MNIDVTTLYKLIMSWDKKEINGYILIEDNITGSDSEDGGADHDFVIQEISSNRYFSGSYTDWDIDYNTQLDEDGENVLESDLDTDLKEVFPKTITTVIYE